MIQKQLWLWWLMVWYAWGACNSWHI